MAAFMPNQSIMMRRMANRKQYHMKVRRKRMQQKAAQAKKQAEAEAAHAEAETKRQQHLNQLEYVQALRDKFDPDQVDQTGQRYEIACIGLSEYEYIDQQFNQSSTEAVSPSDASAESDSVGFTWVKKSVDSADSSGLLPIKEAEGGEAEVIDLSDSEVD